MEGLLRKFLSRYERGQPLNLVVEYREKSHTAATYRLSNELCDALDSFVARDKKVTGIGNTPSRAFASRASAVEFFCRIGVIALDDMLEANHPAIADFRAQLVIADHQSKKRAIKRQLRIIDDLEEELENEEQPKIREQIANEALTAYMSSDIWEVADKAKGVYKKYTSSWSSSD